ncbi:solute carrier family facilitated glucose transporter member 9-like protein [Labeo rohita]|uniref:Solute carrier family 2, facilitated glucose transporter member 9 n=3 Tax=Labeonini TaxID=2743697 RepID=A0ABQ8N034_LABRO|nr:solute carrier family 2 member 15b [Labeo rohita]KAI2668429.1 Solute carrier family 2, facilitated glucose transporter member 9 [Labeo rohita]RXN02819.1 solute carrier family facilitated glucose transporter member 9-like protein [Labeo rohita]
MAEEVLIEPNGKSGGHLTTSLLAVAFLSSFGSSMLYGYNLAVVNSPAVYIKDFFNQTIVRRNGSGVDEETLTLIYSVTVSIFAIGGLVGSLTVGMQVTRFGRRGTLVHSTVLVFIAGGLMGFSRLCGSPEMIIIGRFIIGIHAGISLSVVPMYLGEIAPKNLRGFLGLVPSIFICIGVFIAQILGLHELLGKEEHWPLFFSLVVVPTFIQLMLLPWFPESPRYLLMEKRNIHATITALKWYRAKCNIQAEVEEMQEEQRSLSSVETVSVLQLFRDPSVRWQVVTVLVVNAGMQLSGIDAIWFYTNAIFENAGIPTHQIQYTTVGTGAIEVIAGLIGCFTIERVGRRPLMIGGFSFMGICCAGITFSLLLQAHVSFMRYVSVACVVGIIAGFCIGPAGVPFLMTGELFKQSHRPSAYIVGGFLNWISNFMVGFVFPFLQTSAGAFCYLVFCGVCVGVAAYVFFIIPETKNKTFVEISQMFALRNACKIENQPLGTTDQLKLKKMNGYGTLEPGDVDKMDRTEK